MMTMQTDVLYSQWVRENRAHVILVRRMGARKAALHEATCPICKRGLDAIAVSLSNCNGNAFTKPRSLAE